MKDPNIAEHLLTEDKIFEFYDAVKSIDVNKIKNSTEYKQTVSLIYFHIFYPDTVGASACDPEHLN